MRHYATYLRSVLRHKRYVLEECRREGIPRRGVLHDLSKLLPSEFLAYARYFGTQEEREKAEGTGRRYRCPYGTGDDAFDFAWLRHQKRNDHHWQWWVLPLDDGGDRLLPMSEEARLEMWCDWCGASRAYANAKDAAAWYRDNADHIRLHPETREWVEGKAAAMEAARDAGRPAAGPRGRRPLLLLGTALAVLAVLLLAGCPRADRPYAESCGPTEVRHLAAVGTSGYGWDDDAGRPVFATSWGSARGRTGLAVEWRKDGREATDAEVDAAGTETSPGRLGISPGPGGTEWHAERVEWDEDASGDVTRVRFTLP